jgi:MoaA/NifB/PqqE/SkfB family radical SAM enzyme
MKPRFLFIHAASECNLSCLHCLFWRSHTKDDPNRLSVEKIADIIGEFSELSPQGKVVICGGEPMLEYDRYMGICQAARSVGLRVFTATNGYPIHYAKRAADLLLNGPHEITVSLDSHDSQIHDRIRNRPGSFDTAVRAIRLLVEARRSLDINTSKVNVMVLLTSATYSHLPTLYTLVLKHLQADKLKINALQPSFGVHEGQRPNDEFFAFYSQVDPDVLRSQLIQCNDVFNLNLNPDWIAQIYEYYRSLKGHPNLHLGWEAGLSTTSQICNCSDRNLVIGLYGEIGHCYNFQKFPPSQYRTKGDLEQFWTNNTLRQPMRSCRRLCGIGHSNRSISATLGGQHE